MNMLQPKCAAAPRSLPRLLTALTLCLALAALPGCSRKQESKQAKAGGPDIASMVHGGPQEVALVRAVEAGATDKVKALIEQGADVNAVDMIGRTPFHSAAFYSRPEIATLLLASSAKVNAPDMYGLTPLHAAVLSGSKPVADLLLAKGADVNAMTTAGVTPLHLVAAIGQTPLAGLLLQHGADVNLKDEDGHGALYFATVNKHQEVQEILKKAGAKPEAQPKS